MCDYVHIIKRTPSNALHNRLFCSHNLFPNSQSKVALTNIEREDYEMAEESYVCMYVNSSVYIGNYNTSP